MRNKWFPAISAAAAFLCSLQAGECLVKDGEKIAFAGDSITQFGNRPDGFIHLVMNGLKRNGIAAAAIPAGVGGNNSADILKRLPGILKKKPDWLILQCGTNDVGPAPKGLSAENYRKNIRTVLDAAERAEIRIMLVTPSMRGENPDGRENIRLRELGAFLREESGKRKCLLADWNKAEQELIAARSSIRGLKATIDGVHLDGYGNRALAAVILQTFGIPEEKIAELRREWDRIPSMMPIANAWYNPQYKVTIPDYEVLYRAAEKRGTGVNELVKEIIAAFIERERSQK